MDRQPAIHPIASPEDYAECRRVMLGASKNYSFASRFLPRALLRHVEALYALMRVGDDRVDVTSEGFASPRDASEEREQSYWAAFETGHSDHRVMRAYVNTAREHFAAKGVHVDLIKLYGSMELAPLVGLADAIVDLVSTGGTLKANGLVAVEHITDISSRLVVNQASLKTKRAMLKPLFDAFASAIQT